MPDQPRDHAPDGYANLSPEELKALIDKRNEASDTASTLIDKANRNRQGIVDKMR